MNSEIYKKQQAALLSVPPPPPPPDRNFSVFCNIREDNMAAHVKVVAGSGDSGLADFHIVSALYKKGVKANINYDRILDIVESSRFNKDILVSMGIEPRNGTDAKVTFRGDLPAFRQGKTPSPGEGMEVEADEPLAEVEPATPGLAGLNVRGKRIPAKDGRGVDTMIGPALRVSEDGRSLLAAAPGRAGLSGGSVKILPAGYDDWKHIVRISKNGMEAELVIFPGNGPQPEFGEDFVREITKRNNIKFGINTLLYRLLKGDIESTTKFNLARGEYPLPPSPTRIDEVFRKNEKREQAFCKVNKGELIAIKTRESAGIRGRNIFDEPVEPPPPRVGADFKAGNNTRISEDGLQIFATAPGWVSRIKNTFHVVDCVTLDPKKDHIPPRIVSNKMVRIEGDLPRGRKVISAHHIEITGSVVQSEMAAGGDLRIGDKISECTKTWLQAGGDIYIGKARNSRFYAGMNIFVDELAENCELIADGSVMNLNGGACSVSGGRIIAGENIEIKIIGAGGKPTVVEAGASFKVRSRYNSISREVLGLVKKQDLLKRQIEQMKSGGKKVSATDLKRYDMAHNMVTERITLRTNGLRKLQDRILDSSQSSHITVSDRVFPGSHLKIGTFSTGIREDMRKITFTCDQRKRTLKHSPVLDK